MPQDSVASLSNASLVDRFRRRDQAAFTELFRRHRDLVYRVCLRVLGHHQDAEDAVQETFGRLAKSIDRFDSSRPLEPYLRTIAGNRSRTRLIRRRGQPRLSHWNEVDADPADHRWDPVERCQTSVLMNLVSDYLATLPPNQATAFEMIHQRGWSYQQAADQLGYPIGTIKTWVHRCRIALIDQLRDREEISE